MEREAAPTLWHIPISHYSEKARWALAHKGVEHRLRAPQPPGHMLTAVALTRGRHYTFPVLSIDGRHVGDSSAIIAALERRHPDPPLYPSDPAERERALELERFFDSEVGPAVRLLAWHEVTNDPESLADYASETATPALRRFSSRIAPLMKGFVTVRYGVADPARAEEARGKIVAALDRIEAELGDGDHLVGGRFSVADLAGASLLYPLVRPPEAPKVPPAPRKLEEFRQSLAGRRGYQWVGETFRRHRLP
jgi:glutathione S-transferase